MLRLVLMYELPVVIHCREGRAPEALSCSRECNRVMREIIPQNYQVYNHCLVSEQEARLWVETFPTT